METKTEAEENTEANEQEKKPLKFKNGVEESVWVSFVCATLSSPFTCDDIEADADSLLLSYRARLENDKPSIK